MMRGKENFRARLESISNLPLPYSFYYRRVKNYISSFGKDEWIKDYYEKYVEPRSDENDIFIDL